MRRFLKSPWVLGIGTTVIGGLILSVITDYVKGIDWFSTFKYIIQFIIKCIDSFLNFQIRLWWLLTVIAIVIIVLYLWRNYYEKSEQQKKPAFLEYTTDDFLGYRWKWTYTRNWDGNYQIDHLRPICSRCGMNLKADDRWNTQMKCLRCNVITPWNQTYLEDASLLIEDQIINKRINSMEKRITSGEHTE